MTRVTIRECVKQGYRFPKIVAYDDRNQRWLFVGAKWDRIGPQATAFLTKVREAGSIDPTYWRRIG